MQRSSGSRRQAQALERWRASSQRRPTMIKKRLCHVIFALEERDLKESRTERAKRQKQDRQRQQAAQKAAAKKESAPAKPAEEAKGKEEKK